MNIQFKYEITAYDMYTTVHQTNNMGLWKFLCQPEHTLEKV